ncbi:MAG: hypothetical protein ACRD3R_01835, partial [Terriglobales bacterium]
AGDWTWAQVGEGSGCALSSTKKLLQDKGFYGLLRAISAAKTRCNPEAARTSARSRGRPVVSLRGEF